METILERINTSAKTCDWVHLVLGKKIKLGRSMSSDVRLLSIHVSRDHTVVEHKLNHSEITDLNSKCGVIVNKKKITPNLPHKLVCGDIIEVGRPESDEIEMNKDDMFVYVLRLLDKESLEKLPTPSKAHTTKQTVASSAKRKFSNSPTQNVKRPKCDPNNNCNDEQSKQLQEKIKEISEERETLKESLEAKQDEYNKKLAEKSFQLHETEDVLKEKLKTMSTELQSVKDEEVKLKRELEIALEIKMKEQKVREEEVKKVEERVKLEKEEIMKEKEEKIKEVLKKEETVKQEKDVLEQELKMKEETFQRQLKAKELELKDLKSQADMFSKELQQKEEQRASAETSRSSLLGNLESELQCLFCSEMFINAVTSNCRHSFCQMCIDKWVDRKRECPTCRKAIESLTRSLALDNAVAELVKKMTEEEQRERELIVRERERAAASRDVIDLTRDDVSSPTVGSHHQVDVPNRPQHGSVPPRPRNRRQARSQASRRAKAPWRY